MRDSAVAAAISGNRRFLPRLVKLLDPGFAHGRHQQFAVLAEIVGGDLADLVDAIAIAGKSGVALAMSKVPAAQAMALPAKADLMAAIPGMATAESLDLRLSEPRWQRTGRARQLFATGFHHLHLISAQPIANPGLITNEGRTAGVNLKFQP